MKEIKIYGSWFDEQVKSRAQRDNHNCQLQRAVIRCGSYFVRGYIFTYDGGNTWSYRMMSNGNVKKSLFPIQVRDILSIEGTV